MIKLPSEDKLSVNIYIMLSSVSVIFLVKEFHCKVLTIMILYLLGTKDDNITKHFQRQVGHEYTYHDIQNELLHIMGSDVLRVKVSTICERKSFSIMTDKGTDVRNIEKLLFCVRSVDDNSDVSEDFIGFYDVANEFVDHHPDRKKNFGSFTAKDLQIFIYILFLTSCYLF